MALLIALLALLLVSAIGMGMMYMSTTETSINANYRDTQQAFFSMRAGLEEVRDRIRANAPTPITLPTSMPSSGTAGSIVYLTNPTGSETVDPTSPTNPYFDDEFCHEYFSTLTYGTVPSPTVPCSGSSQAVPSSAVTTIASTSPYTGTSSALSYKWVRITLKQNKTIPTALVAPLDASHPASGQVCWDSANSKEVVVTALGAFTWCSDAQDHGFNVGPVYVVTSLSYTPQGSRRIGQYEVAAVNITPPPAALAMAGPSATFPTAPNSNNLTINGNNTGTGGFSGPGTCNQLLPTQVPAVSTGDMSGQTTVASNIPGGRVGNYLGTAPTLPTGVPAIPSVVDEGTDAGGTGQLSGIWTNPQQLNNLAAMIADGADQTLTCPIGSPCTGSFGDDAHPKITYVNGDLNLTGGAGLLVVTGTLYATGHPSFDGLIMVIGQGDLQFSGGGSGQINGSIFVANTNSRTSPYAQLATLGIPKMSWSGGGTNAIQFNSCWANLENKLHFMVVSSREEMY
jgi:hypothetical protein